VVACDAQGRGAGRLMAQALRLYGALAGAGLRAALQYRVNFVIWIVMGLVFQLTGFVFIWVVLTRFQAIAGWTLGEVAFLYGLRLLGHGTYLLTFGRLIFTEHLIRNADFDRFLVRPAPVLLQAMTREFPVNAIGDFGGGAVLFVAASRLTGVDWSPPALAYLVLTVLGAALIETGIALAIVSSNFRFLSSRALLRIVDDVFSNFGNYPIRIFGGLLQYILTFALPVAFIAYLPATVLLGRTGELVVHPAFAYLAPVAGVVVFGLAYLVWRSEMRHYQSSGH
jgi:ABC-2 type transport system permease protein